MLQGGIGLWGFARKDPSQAGDGLLCRGVVFFQLGSTWDFVPCHICSLRYLCVASAPLPRDRDNVSASANR